MIRFFAVVAVLCKSGALGGFETMSLFPTAIAMFANVTMFAVESTSSRAVVTLLTSFVAVLVGRLPRHCGDVGSTFVA